MKRIKNILAVLAMLIMFQHVGAHESEHIPHIPKDKIVVIDKIKKKRD